MGSQGELFITQAELEEGNLQEPPMSSLELIVVDYRGKELDPLLNRPAMNFYLMIVLLEQEPSTNLHGEKIWENMRKGALS